MPQHSFLTDQAVELRPDPARVVIRPFKPATEPRDLNPTDRTRANHILDRILTLDASEAGIQLDQVLTRFQGRHRDLLATFEARADAMEISFDGHVLFTTLQRQLAGAYFLHEYAFEAAALCNPSMVAHPDQSSAPPGGRRIILSLRAVGEGHISSLTFRTGMVDAAGSVTLDPTAPLPRLPTLRRQEQVAEGEIVEIDFDPESDLSERVILPVTMAQSNGIEDARFVTFEDGGESIFYATYTAYNGRAIRSELIETKDFQSFRMTPLRGNAARNKGMGLFPRKINNRYAMIARQDNENLHLIYSDDLTVWEDGQPIMTPRFPWEFVQIGNCGAPIELDDCWLLLTHGVGSLRQYAIGAALLDKDDPSKVIARSREPLIQPLPSERDGYVPNVVYTCGGMRHGDRLILPYAVCDSFSRISTMTVETLISSLRM